ncbi:MAG: DMT family transporter [Nitrospirae bacterium]|nr:MAG: DMT family transporter [Nitrospirota bacterium]
MLRVLIVMTVASGSAAFGQILIRRGMQQVGSLESYVPADLALYFWYTVSNPLVIGGTVLNTVFYILFLAALSWTDVTVALPMTAIEYGFAAVLAVVILKEVVSPMRWAGIVLVVLGVILISMGGGETPPPSPVAILGKDV